MAEEQNRDDKTEAPSQRRLDQARERGQVAASKDVGHLLLIGSAVIVGMTLAPWSAARLSGVLQNLLERAGTLAGDLPALGQALLGVFVEVALVLAGPLLVFMVLGVGSSMLQNAVVFSTQSLQPQLSRLSPMAGLKRLFGTHTIVELLKSIVKLVVIGTIAFAVLWPERQAIVGAGALETGALLHYLVRLALRLLGAVAAFLVVVAAADWLWQRHHLMDELKMSRQEVKEEYRESEGDPVIKQRQRVLRMERARRRMMTEVPKSTVVVTNPTHFAVALRYDAPTMAAPKIVAKGADLVAKRIRELAREHGVPIVENPPLARALHAAGEPGETIPPAHFQAVAEIIAYVMRLRRPETG